MNPQTYLKLKHAETRVKTPALVFDLDLFAERLLWIKKTTRDLQVEVLFPVKSFPNNRVLKTVASHLDGYDVSNLAETVLTHKPKTLWLTNADGVFKLNHAKWKKYRDHLIVNLPHIEQAAFAPLNSGFQYSIRLNSSQLLGGKAGSSRFGATIEPETIKRSVKALKKNFVGFHVHHGSEANKSEDFVSLLKAILALSKSLKIDPAKINLGGGLGNLVDDEFVSLMRRLNRLLPRKTTLVLEPGRFLTEKCGFAITSVLDGYTRGEKDQTAVLDLSKTAHLIWARQQLLSESPTKNNKTYKTLFCGPTCHEQDVLCEMPSQELKRGQKILLSNISGYSFAWNSSFNGIAKAKVYFLKSGKLIASNE